MWPPVHSGGPAGHHGASRRWSASLVLTVTALPYLVGSGFAGGGQQFMGIAFDAPDTAQYFAWMRAFAHTNSLLIANPLTPEPNHAAFFNLLWFSLGHLGQFLHAHPPRCIRGFAGWQARGFLAVLWVLCGAFCAPGWERRLAWLLATLGRRLRLGLGYPEVHAAPSDPATGHLYRGAEHALRADRLPAPALRLLAAHRHLSPRATGLRASQLGRLLRGGGPRPPARRHACVRPADRLYRAVRVCRRSSPRRSGRFRGGWSRVWRSSAGSHRRPRSTSPT